MINYRIECTKNPFKNYLPAKLTCWRLKIVFSTQIQYNLSTWTEWTVRIERTSSALLSGLRVHPSCGKLIHLNTSVYEREKIKKGTPATPVPPLLAAVRVQSSRCSGVSFPRWPESFLSELSQTNPLYTPSTLSHPSLSIPFFSPPTLTVTFRFWGVDGQTGLCATVLPLHTATQSSPCVEAILDTSVPFYSLVIPYTHPHPPPPG